MSFPRLKVPRPPQNTKPVAGSRPPEKPFGFVKPAAELAGERSKGGYAKITTASVAAKAPAPPVDLSKPLTAADIPWNW